MKHAMQRWSLIPAVFLATAVLTTVGLVCQAADPIVGTWKENVARSTYDPGPKVKSRIYTLEPYEGVYKMTQDWVTADGQSHHSEDIVRLDGKEYPVQEAQPPTTQAYKRIDDRSYERFTRVNGKLTEWVVVVISRDGKTQTATQTGTNTQGRPIDIVMFYDRE